MAILGRFVTDSQVVEIVGTTPVVEAIYSVTSVVEVPTAVGPRGPAGGGAFLFEQAEPLASWTIPHGVGRLPVVSLIVNGEPVSTKTVVTSTFVYVTWPYPVAGTAILV